MNTFDYISTKIVVEVRLIVVNLTDIKNNIIKLAQFPTLKLAHPKNIHHLCSAQHKNQGMQVVNLHIHMQVIFMTSLKIFCVIVPPCEVLMYSQHSLNVLSNGKGNDTFFYIYYAQQFKKSNLPIQRKSYLFSERR